MPAAVHPWIAEQDRLAAEAAANPTPDEEPVSSEVVAEAVATPEVEAPAVEARDPEEDNYLKLDKRQAYKSLRELAAQDKSVNDALETYAGRRAKAKYEPELETLKAELTAAKQELRRKEFEKLTAQEVSERFGTDAKFAEEYTAAVHNKPVDPEVVRQAQQIRSMFHQELERAEQSGVPLERLAQVEGWIKTGAFDKTPDGRVLSPIESYRWVREVVDNDINIHRPAALPARAPEAPAVAAPAPVAVAEKPAPTPNPRLQEASPDLSASSHSSGGMQRISRAEYYQMSPPERKARWETHDDFVREVNAGLFTD